jgi:hypothetical protein
MQEKEVDYLIATVQSGFPLFNALFALQKVILGRGPTHLS